jgi:hypothetical protein
VRATDGVTSMTRLFISGEKYACNSGSRWSYLWRPAMSLTGFGTAPKKPRDASSPGSSPEGRPHANHYR